jgi:hypothetical protein
MPGENYGSIVADSTLRMEGTVPFATLAAMPNYSGRMIFLIGTAVRTTDLI